MEVSVVIPTYNRWKTLRHTLLGLQAQTQPAHEIIVVDDGSSDETRTALPRRFPNIRYIRQNNAGPAAARNRGIDVASGDIIAFTDDDCLPPNDWLEKLADGFLQYPKVVGVGGALIAPPEILSKNIFAQYEHYIAKHIYKVGDVEMEGGFECPAGGTATMAYYKRTLLEFNGFDTSFPVAAGEDADLKFRICQKGYRLLYIPNQMLHLQDYTWPRLRRQFYVRGVGRNYYEKLHGAGYPSRFKIALRIIRRLLDFPRDLILMPPTLAVVKLADGLITCQGQWNRR